MSYSPASKKSLGEQAYEQIREAIVTLQFKPGQMVFESELGGSLGMSRTPVREGIRMLLMEDLIEVLPQRGMRVSLISHAKVEDIRFVRESLEVSAFRKVAGQWRQDDRRFALAGKQLANLLDEQRVAAEEGDVLAFLNLDEAFHRLIMEQTRNHTLIAVVSQMRSHLNRVRLLGLRGNSSMESLINEHQSMVNAVMDNDEETTVNILTYHLRRLRADLAPLQEKFPDYFID